MSAVSVRNGVAIITTPTRQTEVHLSATASIILEGYPIRASKSDLVALSAGYLELEKQVAVLQAELAAARAGAIGLQHATAMHGARKALADLNKVTGDFLEVYDSGEGPDSMTLRDALGAAEMWLLRDVKAAGQRAKLLEGGAA